MLIAIPSRSRARFLMRAFNTDAFKDEFGVDPQEFKWQMLKSAENKYRAFVKFWRTHATD